MSHTKKHNNNLTVYDDKKHFNHQGNKKMKLSTIIKKKPKENLLVISTDMNLKRRRTSILNAKSKLDPRRVIALYGNENVTGFVDIISEYGRTKAGNTA